MYKNIIFMVAAILLTSCGLIPNTYLAAPISGTVIDGKTKQPLEGVIVVIYWDLHEGGLAGRHQSGNLHVEETVTDNNGKYHFKGWGPVSTFSGRLGYESPELLIFKRGYYFQRKGNYRTKMYFGKKGAGEIHVPIAENTEDGILYRSLWDEKVIELKEGNYFEKKYVHNLDSLSSEMAHIIQYAFKCEKKTIFGLINFVRNEIIELNKLNIKHSLSNPDWITAVKECK